MPGGMGGGQAPQAHTWAHVGTKVQPRRVVRMSILRTTTSVEPRMLLSLISVSLCSTTCKCAALKKKAAAADFDEKWSLRTRDRAGPSKCVDKRLEYHPLGQSPETSRPYLSARPRPGALDVDKSGTTPAAWREEELEDGSRGAVKELSYRFHEESVLTSSFWEKKWLEDSGG